MQEVVAPVYNITFDIEVALDQQLGALPLPFPGMDSECLLCRCVVSASMGFGPGEHCFILQQSFGLGSQVVDDRKRVLSLHDHMIIQCVEPLTGIPLSFLEWNCLKRA